MVLNMFSRRNVNVVSDHFNAIITEEYNRIRTNIEFSSIENNCRSIAITSPTRGEGKSTTATNIAYSLAREGKKVLLIDASIKTPMLNMFFRIKNTFGLTNILAGQKLLEEVINQTETNRLHLLTSGPIPLNTEKLFKSMLMDKLMEEAKGKYDFVIIDTPGILEDPDTKILANRSDGVILVVRNRRTEDVLALEAKKALEIANAKFLGVILNGKRSTKIFKG
ncbi:CpsD/CapB family tyrosine-protein kinase [Bacillus suaedae]|uniref:non-specific protein-tyrosine kinase n=1 Tax=Halalkalibacter suaedae TaxID=2822140 RepID=A0A940WVV3_9BACI|nr:CpsD/CapB family tyrosine-protein kinase [Bacillus suaedae]MBP3951527.1 CpsD/CapB family tyrosine-protein kinase [Bacillus suaedae]